MPNNKIDISLRLREVRRHLGVASGEFASKSNIDPRNYSSIETGKRNVGERVLRDICSAFPINIDWLLTGEGEMLKDSKEAPLINYEGKGVPYYDVDFIGGFEVVENSQVRKPEYYIDFKPYNNAELWINITGHSMDSKISHGDFVALREVRNWLEFLPFGEIYAIVTDEFRTVKIVTQGSRDDLFLLMPFNQDPQYKQQEIPKKLIRKVFQVLGSVKRF